MVRVVTIGMELPQAVRIAADVPLNLRPGQILVVDWEGGSRLVWGEYSGRRTLAGVLPSPSQRDDIRRFVEDEGGTVFTIAARQVLTCPPTLFFRAEISSHWADPAYPVTVAGDLAELALSPVDFLPTRLHPGLAQLHMLVTTREECSPPRWGTHDGFMVMTHMLPQVGLLKWGRGTVAVCRTRSLVHRPAVLTSIVAGPCSLEVSA
jgi:hypothetical protein